MEQISVNTPEGEDLMLSLCAGPIFQEMRRAEGIFPTWPENLIEATATVSEESGEALQVSLNMRPHDPHCGGPKGTISALRKELVQTAAMAIRALMHLPEEK